MGSGGVEKENKNLKEKIENELEPQILTLNKKYNEKSQKEKELQKTIEKITKEKKDKINKEKELLKKIKDLENKNNQQQKEINKNKIDLSPEDIQKMMQENAKKDDEITSLKRQLVEKQKYVEMYSQLLSENNQLKMTCAQYQLMLLHPMNNLNQNNFFNNNFNNSINGSINNNFFNSNNNIVLNNNNNYNNNNCGNFNNNVIGGNSINNNFCNNNFIMNNNMNNNFNNSINNKNNSKDIITIIFKLEDGQKYPITTYNYCKLRDVFNLALIQNRNNEYSNIYRLKFYYNAIDLTEHFINNDNVEILNLAKTNVIDIIKLKNIIK